MSDPPPAWPEWDAAPLRRGASVENTLGEIPGAVWFRIPGRDAARSRAVTTLLHGNEPSGFHALRRYLAGGDIPAVDLICVLGGVRAAQIAPAFSHRFLPGGLDLNRCFREPFRGEEGETARKILELLGSKRPECLVDLHNTSGEGPSYAVVTQPSAAHDAIASCFTDRLIVTDLRLGTLTEATTSRCPSVVVECGGARDAGSHEVALRGLRRFADTEHLEAASPERLETFEHPVRVELAQGCHIAFSDHPVSEVEVVLKTDLDRFNFGVIPAETHLGWVGARGVEALQLRNARGAGPVDRFLTHRGDRLISAEAFRPLMITTRPDIAESDCLFYAIAD